MKYYLFRHGSTRASTTNNVYVGEEIVTAEILTAGKPAIAKLGKHLATKTIDLYCTSPFKRCLDTMEIIKIKTAQSYFIDDRLGEFREDLNEPFDKFSNRIKKFLDAIKEKNYESVAICTHGACLSAIKHWLINDNYNYADLMDFPVSGVLWIVEDGKLEEIDFANYRINPK